MTAVTIADVSARDIRFPTSRGLHGSDAMNPDPVGASLEGRVLEYVDHLHEHFLEPVRIRAGRYMAPRQPGYSAAMRPESLDEHDFPAGAAWTS